MAGSRAQIGDFLSKEHDQALAIVEIAASQGLLRTGSIWTELGALWSGDSSPVPAKWAQATLGAPSA